MQYNASTLEQMAGVVQRVKPSLDRTLAIDYLNFRQRQIIDMRPYWSGLLKRTTINVPPAYTTGNITLTSGSTVITGTSTNWPVSDITNTTIPLGIPRPGNQWFTPADMTGLSDNSILYCDSAGTPEVITIQQTKGTQCLANFQFPHNAASTITQSSLANLQLQTGTKWPYYTVLAITSSTGMIVDAPWSDISMSNRGYQIIMAYTTIANNVKEILSVVDPIQPLNLLVHVPQNMLNNDDPARQSFDYPIWLVDLGPNLQGQMQYEFYPAPTQKYQFNVLYYIQWPDMVLPGDRPPHFINPTVLIYGALADALRTRNIQNPNGQDPWYDPRSADQYEAKFQQAVNDLITADNSKAQRAYEWEYARWGLGGANFAQQHAYDSGGQPIWW